VRVPELVLGIGLAAAGALASVLWASREPSQRVLIAARALHRGETVNESMVRWATVSGDRIVGIADPSVLRDTVVRVDIDAGAPIQPTMLQGADALAAGEVEVGVALEPGDFPPSLATGDRVSVVLIGASDPTGIVPAPRVLAVPVRVRAVSEADTATGNRTIASLAVSDRDLAAVLAAARVRLAVLPLLDPTSAG
jgi:uncharacterized protein